MIKRSTKKKWNSYKKSNSRFRNYRKYGNLQKQSFLNARRYKLAQITKSAIAHKIHSVRSISYDSESKSLAYRVDEICPYKSENFFWTKAGGALIDQDIHCHKVYVRGGEWRVTMVNMPTMLKNAPPS